MPQLEELKARINHALKLGKISSTDYITKGMSGVHVVYNKQSFSEFRSTALSLISSLFGTRHTYYIEFLNRCQVADETHISSGIGILRSIKTEVENGWLYSIRRLVSAEVFSDFLEMAEYLLKEGYKDPSAVMIGGVLEEHLKQLCDRNGIETYLVKEGKSVPKKADLLNSELVKKEVYNILDQKQVTAWLDLRNKAAHGKYEDYSKDQVSFMYQGVVEFIARVN